MKHIIQLTISKDNDWYIAEGVNLPVVTQAQSLDELMNNVREVVSLMFEDEDPATYGLSSRPSILVNYELNQGLRAA